MKIRIDCPTCMKTLRKEGKSGELIHLYVEPTNDGYYEITCNQGHEIEMEVLYHDFEILFEIGINAIVDGYYREAINSFAASYERFLVFFIQVILRSSEIDKAEINSVFVKVNRSERQLGAYIILYLKTFGQVPNILSRTNVDIRNDVIHKGDIPTIKKCVKYGNAVLKFIRENIIKLYESHHNELIGAINYRFRKDDDWKTRKRAHQFLWLTIGVNRPPGADGNPTVEDILQRLR